MGRGVPARVRRAPNLRRYPARAMDPGPDTPHAPPGVPFRIRDAVFVWMAAIVVGTTAAGIALGITGDDAADPGWAVTASGVVGQFATIGFGAWVVSRVRGSGSLRRDVGLTLRGRDWWAVPAGVGAMLGLALVILPLVTLVDERQRVVEDLETATGPELAVLAVTAALLAPLFEEVLFRGLLLRALLRRMGPGAAIWVSAVAFGVVHLLDPSLGTLVRVPALVGFGLLAGHRAVRTGSLSQPVLLHFGFNLLTVGFALSG